ncbi:MAG: LysR family transcriptional regulator substrate-binding protein [Cyclobacteriaceae bacterium]|nr:LysR family transcriptional regulator substrate-binding protein [Cyclobacteriaceae bacterium]
MKNFLAIYPNNDFSIFECGSNDMNVLLSNDTIDFGTGFETITKGSAIEFEKLFTSKLKVICSENNTMADADIVKIEDILELPYISYSTNSVIKTMLENYLPAENINQVLNAQYSETIIKYVQLNFGVSIVPDYILKLLKPTRIAIKELDVELPIDFGLFKDKNKYFSTAHKKCIELVKIYYKKSIEQTI